MNFTYTTRFGRFDCLGEPSGSGGYEDLAATALAMPMFGVDVLVAAPQAMLQMKLASGRPKDLGDIAYLQTIADAEDGIEGEPPRT